MIKTQILTALLIYKVSQKFLIMEKVPVENIWILRYVSKLRNEFSRYTKLHKFYNRCLPRLFPFPLQKKKNLNN